MLWGYVAAKMDAMGYVVEKMDTMGGMWLRKGMLMAICG